MTDIFFLFSDRVLLDLGKLVHEVTIPKSAIGWDLELLERLTHEVQDRESDSDDDSE